MLLPDIFIFILTGLVLLLILTDIYSDQLSVLVGHVTNNFMPSLLDLSASSPWQFSRGAGIKLSLWGAGLGAGSLLLLWYLTAKQGIGFGDVKLMIPLGLLFGPIHTILLLFTAFICGGVMGSYLLLTKRANLKTAVPFGPFLAGTAIIFIIFPKVPTYLLSLII
jgi:prepilin signal peptidase PulO-like enzyme (type II secretory pathway)